MNRDEATILDIVFACEDIAEFIGAITLEGFLNNHLVQAAVTRKLEIIGEATKRLSAEFRQNHAEIPWKAIAGLRDQLIHGYDDVDYPLVWRIATHEVPMLCAHLRSPNA